MTGKVKWFNNQRGFGFITDDGKDVFVIILGLQVKDLRN